MGIVEETVQLDFQKRYTYSKEKDIRIFQSHREEKESSIIYYQRYICFGTDFYVRKPQDVGQGGK